jgi:hypothetical protein
MSTAFRNFIPYLLIICLTGFMMTFTTSCKKDPVEPDLTGAEQVRELLVGGAWSLQSLQVDGTDQTGLFSGLSLSFTGTGFTATGGEPVWPASGTWSFDDDSGESITRADGIAVAINSINDTSLQLTLTWEKTTLGSGRTGSVSGVHVFLFGR